MGEREGVRRGLSANSAIRDSKSAGGAETPWSGTACGRTTTGRPLNKSRSPSAFGQGSPSSSSSTIGNGVWENEHGHVVTSPAVGQNLVEYAPQKQCLKKTWMEADMARRCPWVKDPRTKSEGVEDSGTGITPPVQGQTGGSAQSPCSWAQSRKGKVFNGAWASLGGRRMCWISARSSARLKSFPRGPGHLHAKVRGSARDSFLLSLVGRGSTEVVM